MPEVRCPNPPDHDGWLDCPVHQPESALPQPLSPLQRLHRHAQQDIHDWQDDRVAGHVLCPVCGVSRHDWLNMRESRAKLEALPQSLMTEFERQQADEIVRLRAFGQDMAHRAGREEDRAAQLTREIEQLRAALAEAIELAEDAIPYVGEHLQQKFGYAEDLAKLHAVLAKHKST